MLWPERLRFCHCRTFLSLDRFLLLFLHVSLEILIRILMSLSFQVWRHQLILGRAILKCVSFQAKVHISSWCEEFFWCVGILQTYARMLWRSHFLWLGLTVKGHFRKIDVLFVELSKTKSHVVEIRALFL